MEFTKVCRKCHEEKTAVDFSPDKRNKDKLCGHCKKCRAAATRDRNQRPDIKEKRRKYFSEYRSTSDFKRRRSEYRKRPDVRAKEQEYENTQYRRAQKAAATRVVYHRKLAANPKAFKLRKMLIAARTRATRERLDFEITAADFPDLDYISVCPVLSIEFDWTSSKCCAASPSIDRIDNSLGYVPGNVRLISWRANSLKSDAVIEELEAVIRYMRTQA
jgi:hypothetical protein